jgi:hypothetical protein
MLTLTLRDVADAVVRHAQRHGYVVPRDIRAELRQAGLPDDQWKEVVNLARQALNCRHGRYYHITALSPRLQQVQEQQRLIQHAIRRVIRLHQKKADLPERRQHDRVDFVQPVTVTMEDGRQFTLLTRDLSLTGIRLVGTRRLLGQKVRVSLPQGGDTEPCTLAVRILWTCAIGEDLFENGGTFLEIISK